MLDKLDEKRLHRWLGRWALERVKRVRSEACEGPQHVLFALCDHFEPLLGDASDAIGDARVQAWSDGYPALASEFRDSEGRPPRHTFFFPGEQYRAHWLDALGDLARRGFGEVEVHLHHDRDEPKNLRNELERHSSDYARHGHLSHGADGRPRYAFIHGNWCLANSRPDGRWCGVDAELPILFETGCYADFTFPSAPDATQPAIVNQIYWPSGDLSRARAHEQGETARVGDVKNDRILMIQGPLALARRPGRRLSMRIENGALTANDPATESRVKSWVEQAISVEGRPEWIFVKVHTHGAPEAQARSLLGEGGRALHRALARYADGQRALLHYVTAREMFNVAMAAMSEERGNPAEFRDYILPPPALCS